jgi:hypothetical protein
MGRNHIHFKLDFGENAPVKKSLQMNWFAFQHFVYCSKSHILDQVVLLCISTSVAQIQIIFWFLV